MAVNFAKVIDLAIQEGGQQGQYNWTTKVRDVFKNRYKELGLRREQVDPGGEYGNTFQNTLSRLLPSTADANFMANNVRIAANENKSVGEITARNLASAGGFKEAGADFARLNVAGDLIRGTINPEQAEQLRGYIGDARFFQDASGALASAQTQVRNLERSIAQAQQQYAQSPLGMESTKATYEPRLASLNAQLEKARDLVSERQQRVNTYADKLNESYQPLAGVQSSFSAVPVEQAANLFKQRQPSPANIQRRRVVSERQPVASQGLLQDVAEPQPTAQLTAQPAAQPTAQMASVDPVQMQRQSLFNSLINPEAPRLQNIQQPSFQSYLGGLNTREYLDLINRLFTQY